MADHTPTTEAVRNAYISAMRNAHVTSAGEAGAEFDRWIAERDDALSARKHPEPGAEYGVLFYEQGQPVVVAKAIARLVEGRDGHRIFIRTPASPWSETKLPPPGWSPGMRNRPDPDLGEGEQ